MYNYVPYEFVLFAVVLMVVFIAAAVAATVIASVILFEIFGLQPIQCSRKVLALCQDSP